ncbi:MAG: FKBP-type peptidyl-prolyl cis-trans isomerase [Microbacterium sp.]|uniref:FKBP-type peptidyl-prolyl cis-trans isomerase n=1 Tax=Microbacterium sp. TaxID=51671 RepID=UPI003F7E83C4
MRVRSLFTLPVLAAVTLAFAGCTAAPQPSARVTPPPTVDMCALAAPSGSVSAGVTVTGELGEPRAAALPAPLTITAPERTVVVDGGGEKIDGSSLIDVASTTYDAATGQEVASTGQDGTVPLPVPAAGLAQSIGCATVGSRIVVGTPSAEGSASTIEVIDVLGIRPDVATGTAQQPVDGMPAVTLEDGVPQIVIPNADPPEKTRVAVLKKGDGEKVAPGDRVMAQYTSVRWSDHEIIGSSWMTGAPTVFVPADVVPGLREAFDGQTVGSQVLVVIPPAAAYGTGEINPDDLVGETVVFVLDLLATAPAA